MIQWSLYFNVVVAIVIQNFIKMTERSVIEKILEKHNLPVPQNTKTFSKGAYKMEFQQENIIQSQDKIPSTSNKFQCDYCTRGFTELRNLFWHVRIVRGKSEAQLLVRYQGLHAHSYSFLGDIRTRCIYCI